MANLFIDALAGTSWLEVGLDNTITYYFDDDGSRAWTASEKDAFRSALQTWANVANVVFTEVFTEAEADISESLSDSASLAILAGAGTVAFHLSPERGGTVGVFAADGSPDTNPFALGNGDAVPGSYSYSTFVHELGHALGLAHPHDTGQGTTLFPGVTRASDLGRFELNQTVYTVMSYNEPGVTSIGVGHVAGPMAFDIAAIQALYGANRTFASDDTIYDLSENVGLDGWMSIWDTGGTDAIVYTGTFFGVTIDLAPASLRLEAGGGGHLSSVKTATPAKGYTIAHGVLIENASGGSENDDLSGNGAANTLDGKDGNDRLHGRGGNDVLVGGFGNDWLGGDAGADTLRGGSGNDSYDIRNGLDVIDDTGGRDAIVAAASVSLAGYADMEDIVLLRPLVGSLSVTLTGDSGDNRITGDDGRSLLDGGAGRDTLAGGAGADTYIVRDAADVITELRAAGFDTIRSSISIALTRYANIEQAELVGSANLNATGSSGDNVLFGNSGRNTILGGAGGDLIAGLGGRDTLDGGSGNDTYQITDSTGDVIIDASGIDTAQGFLSVNLASSLLNGIENVVLSGVARLNAYGDAFNNRIEGNAGANALFGNAGNDVLNGNQGLDTLSGGAGRDIFELSEIYQGSGPFTRAKIIDFNVADDTIRLRGLEPLGNFGQLADEKFWASANGKAHDASDRIIYNTTTGNLAYDSDGTGSGGAVVIATLSSKLGLTAADFIIL